MNHVTVASAYPAVAGTTVWIQTPGITGIALRLPVDAWAVLDDGAVVPIVRRFAEETPRAAIGQLWHEDLDRLSVLWADSLPRLPLMPQGTSINGVPVGVFDEVTVIIGPVGLGAAVWGPYTLPADCLVAGLDLVASATPLYQNDDMAMLLPDNLSECRVTWEDIVQLEGEPSPMIIVEPAAAQ